MSGFGFREAAASTYDQNTGALLSRQLVPWVIRAARIGPGHRVLDIATGTGLVAAAAAALVGSTGHVVAADLSPAMIEQARGRLGALPNVSLEIQNAQSLPYPDETFDAVTCGLGMMFFPDPAAALAEFHRVLRPGGHVSVSVNPDASRTLVLRVLVAIGRRVPGRAARSRAARSGPVAFDGRPERLRTLFEDARFRDIVMENETKLFSFPSFDAWFGPIGRGEGLPGQVYAGLPEDVRAVVKADLHQEFGGGDDPITVEVDVGYACGRR
jgi:ubiquinone/menaquinone biosynthesis C-methylase UbiE